MQKHQFREEELLVIFANTEIEKLQGMRYLFIEHDDLVIENFVNGISNDHFQIVGSELILGKIYDKIGFPNDGCPNYFENSGVYWFFVNLGDV